MTKIKSLQSIKKAFIIFLTALLLVTVFTPKDAMAATNTATVTKSYKPMEAEGPCKSLDVYGQDTFKITYDKSSKKITSVNASQKTKTLGTDMVEKGGIKLIKKTAKTWTYKATWYLNFTVLPKPVQYLGKLVKSKIAMISSLGRICTVTVTYEVSADGKLKHDLTYKFQVPSKVQDIAKYLSSLFTKAF